MKNSLIISILLIITVAVPLFFSGWIYSVFDLSKVTILYILTFILLGVWAIRGGVPHANTLTYPILAVLFSSILSTILAVNPYVSFAGTYKRYGGLLTLMVCMVIFFAVTEFVTKQKIATFINVVILTSSVAALHGIAQSLNLDPYAGHWQHNFGLDGRAVAGFGHPTFLGAYMAMTLPLVLYKILQRKWWMYPIAGLLIYALFECKARSAFVGLIVALIYFFVLYRKNISYKLIGVVLSAIIVLSVFMPHSPVKRLQGEIKNWNPQGNIAYRVRIAMTCLDIFRDNPVVGIGMDCLAMKYARYYELRYGEKCDRHNNRAHNAILEVLVTQGIVGLLAWLYLVVAYFWMVIRNRKNLLVVALSSGVVAYGIQDMFSFGGIGITPLFWMLMAMTVVSASRIPKTRSGITYVGPAPISGKLTVEHLRGIGEL